MKNICLSLVVLMGVMPQFAQASRTRKQPSVDRSVTEVCARKPSELARSPELAEAMAGFGGLQSFEGSWKMAGFISVFAKANVHLSHSRSTFSVEINKDYSKPFYMCVSAARPDLITMHIPQADNPDFAKLTLKPGRTRETMYVAAKKTDGKFIKFKRVSGN